MTAATMFAALGLQAAYLTAPITIDTVKVGDAGNAADTGGTVGKGAVAYEYNIGTTSVTAGQYTAFLNAVASTSDAYGLYNASMASNANGCGITATTVGGVTTYATTKGANMPVNFVSVYDAMRFCNWLTTGDTESGVYMLGGAANDISLVVRNDAAWQAGGVAIASLDEWYKAAFYNGTTGVYSKFANGKDTITTAEANYANSVGTITDVFAYGTTSSYGVLDMNGNVYEWTDTITGSATNVYLRGGRFNNAETTAVSSYNYNSTAADETSTFGFRVSSLQPIPEPSTYAAIFGALALAVAAYRRRK